MDAPTRLSNWPWVVVRVDCKLCPRHGCYRLARLAQQFGAEMGLERLVAVLARDCPYWRNDPQPYEVRCGARLTDWDLRLPKLDMPPRTKRLEPSRRPGPHLADPPGPVFTIVCRPCRRRGVLSVARIAARFGADMPPLPTLLRHLARGCSGLLEPTPRCQALMSSARVPMIGG